MKRTLSSDNVTGESQVTDILTTIPEIQNEVNLKASILLEMIPSDVWVSIFRLLTKKQDVSVLVSLSLVCKQWFRIFSDNLNETSILNPLSVKCLNIPNLHTLTIATKCNIPFECLQKSCSNLSTLKLCQSGIKIDKGLDHETRLDHDCVMKVLKNLKYLELYKTSEMLMNYELWIPPIMDFTTFTTLTNLQKLKINLIDMKSKLLLETLRSFPHLKKLVIYKITYDHKSLDLFLLHDSKNYEYIRIPKLIHFSSFQIQKNNPNVRFLWSFEKKLNKCISYDIYEGEIGESNLIEGKGVYRFINGNRYEGDWKNGMREGKGIFFYNDGSRYEGDFKKDLKEGKGVYYYADGGRYEGEWKNNKKEGNGVNYFKDGKRYEGDWKNGMKEGKGIFFHNDGSRYEGDFKKDLKEGKGVYYYADGGRYDGKRYEGEFKDNDMEGKGIFYWEKKDNKFTDGDKFEGGWKNGLMDGHGIFTYENGDIFEGNWKNGTHEGKGIYIYASGIRYECIFNDEGEFNDGIELNNITI